MTVMDEQDHLVGRILFRLYGLTNVRCVRALIRRGVLHADGGNLGQLYSRTLRRIFQAYHGVTVGLYSWSGCFVVGSFRPGTTIGRYCEIAESATAPDAPDVPAISAGGHADAVSSAAGARTQGANRPGLEIGNDVWIGHAAIILPSVARIGDGAVIGAGAVVHRSVPPYAVVVGNPARVVRYRFTRPVVGRLLTSRWWDRSIEELSLELQSFQVPVNSERSVSSAAEVTDA